jgi:thiol-disulfide isomerase/thioredoxin
MEYFLINTPSQTGTPHAVLMSSQRHRASVLCDKLDFLLILPNNGYRIRNNLNPVFMLVKLKQLLKIRGVKITLEILVILLVFIAIRTYMQRDLAAGPAPQIRGTLIDGQSFNLQSLQGKPVLLYFWATWCPVCKMQNGSVAAISKDHAVITVAMNSGTDLEIDAFLNEKKLDFPALVDDAGSIASQFGVNGVPASFVIDPDGNIAFTEVGYTTEWGLRVRLWLAGL